jgi:hypothetical protein
VPHSQRANTAAFLEEVISYIDTLKCRVKQLEEKLSDADPKREIEGSTKEKKRKTDGAPPGKETAVKKTAT